MNSHPCFYSPEWAAERIIGHLRKGRAVEAWKNIVMEADWSRAWTLAVELDWETLRRMDAESAPIFARGELAA